MLHQFSELDKDHDGQINASEFSELMGLPNTGYTRDLFNLFDDDHSGTIDFKEFVIGLSMISSSSPGEETIEMAFKALDVDGNGKIRKPELMKLLSKCFNTITEEEITHLFDTMDEEHQGFIDHGRFKVFF
jgi:Ca2+-binding EF-hand superfamily protein